MKKVVGFALVAAAVAAVAKVMTTKKAEWEGLTEPEVREKLEQRMPSRVPDEKRAEAADKVVAKMRDRGMLREEPAEAVADVEGEATDVAEQSEWEEPAAVEESPAAEEPAAVEESPEGEEPGEAEESEEEQPS